MNTNDAEEGRTSSRRSKTYSRRGESKVAYPTRLPEDTYDALMAASAVTGSSANSLVAEALEHYLTSPEFQTKLERRRRDQEEAIKRLSGG